MTANSSPSIVVLHNPALHVRRHLLYKKLQSQLPDSAYTYVTTGDYEKDLKALKAACKGASSLIAVGGDGTLNLAVNAIANTSTVLGVVPAGSGNDFARVWVAGMSANETITTALTGQPIEIDLGKANDRYFLNNLGIGFDGELVRRLKHKTWPRKFSYIGRALQLLPTYKAQPLVLQESSNKVNGGLLPKSFMLSIGNGRYFGAGIPVTPHARLNDGVLAYTHVKERNRASTVRCLLRMLLQKHLKMKAVNAGQLDKLTVKNSGVPMQVDGEYLGYSPVTVEVCPAALKIRKLG